MQQNGTCGRWLRFVNISVARYGLMICGNFKKLASFFTRMESRTNIVKILVQNTQLSGPNARLDKFLSGDDNLLQYGVTRSGLTKLFDQNRITIDGVPAKKSQKVHWVSYSNCTSFWLLGEEWSNYLLGSSPNSSESLCTWDWERRKKWRGDAEQYKQQYQECGCSASDRDTFGSHLRGQALSSA